MFPTGGRIARSEESQKPCAGHLTRNLTVEYSLPMTSLEGLTKSPSPDDCAANIMETIPTVMRLIRVTMRQRRPSEISEPQFRALIYLSRRQGTCLSEMAEDAGLTLPTVSKMVYGLVKRGFVRRRPSRVDRRRVTLSLTPLGREVLESVFAEARARLSSVLSTLSDEERAVVADAMRYLRGAFSCASSRECGSHSK